MICIGSKSRRRGKNNAVSEFNIAHKAPSIPGAATQSLLGLLCETDGPRCARLIAAIALVNAGSPFCGDRCISHERGAVCGNISATPHVVALEAVDADAEDQEY